MATSLTSNVTAGLGWTFQNVLPVITGPSLQSALNYKNSTKNGTSAGQCDLLYVTTGTISASGSLNIDLAGSVLDFFGNTITFARVKSFIIILTADTAAASVLVGNGTNPFVNWVGSGTHTVRVRNTGCLLLASSDSTGYAVTASTGDILKILNEDSGNVATYQIAFVGCSV